MVLQGILPILHFITNDPKLKDHCPWILLGEHKIKIPRDSPVNLFNLVGDADSSSTMLRNIQAIAAKVHPRRCTQAFDCLAQCGLRDGLPGWGQFCIDNQLAAGLRGDVNAGLFFRGVGAMPFGPQIATVRQLIERLLTPGVPLGTPVRTALGTAATPA